jgi:RHS repeat-associated protein
VDYLYLKEAIHQDGIHAAKKKIFASSQVDGLAKLSYQAGEQIVFEEGFTIEAKEGGRFETNLTSTCPTNLATTGGFEQTSDNDYLYDKNGNLKEDPNKKMDIYYNYLNLPYKVVFENGNQIEWLYDASGKKLQKKSFKQTELLSTRDYIEGIELKDGVLEAIYHSEGRAVAKDGQFEYEYNLSDHLGNNRVLFSDTNNDGGIDVNTEILQTSDYYPFGMEMKGDFRKNERVAQQYLYNGKELDSDFGLNWYHYGARMYDPAVGRFTGVDPISDQFAWVSTYNYAENEPIANIDLWGLQRLPFGIKEKARAILNQLGFKEQPAKSRHWTPTAGDFHDSGSEVGTGLEVMTGDNKLPGAGTSDQATAKDGSTAIIDEILTAGPGISSKFAKDKVGQPLNALNRISDIKQKIEKIDSRISEPDSSSPKEEEAKDTISATDYGSYIMYKLSSKNTEANKKDNDNDE